MTRSIRALTVLGIAALGIVLLTACAAKPAAPVELTQNDSGTTQALATGQELLVTLDSNPTTGYRWSLDGALPSTLKQAGEPKFTSGSSAMGAGGAEVWTFTGAAAGDAKLRLKYWRSFEPTAAPAKTFVVTVSVK
jgi:inhibitor of cysteine peptidase